MHVLRSWEELLRLLNICLLPSARSNFEIPEGKEGMRGGKVTFHIFFALTRSRVFKTFSVPPLREWVLISLMALISSALRARATGQA